MEKITIIGAGPVGSKCAEELAIKSNRVRVFEEHKKIGEPIQCTGIVTKDLFDIVKPNKKWIVNRLNKVEINTPNGTKTVLKTTDIVIDRTKFDCALKEKAEKEGVKFILGKKVKNIEQIRKNSKEIIVGADGPNSIVAKRIGNSVDCLIGLQAVVKGKFDPTTYKVFFGREHPGFFGWIVPENEEIARVGTAGHYNPRIQLDRMLKKVKGKVQLMQGGLIPIYNSKNKIEERQKYLVGDAAGQVKATTGGGLVPGISAAKILAECITEKKKYSKELKNVRKKLQKHKMLRGLLDRFTDKDYNNLIELLENQKLKEILEKETRENPGRIMIKSIIKEPRVLKFAKVLLRTKTL